MVSDGPPLRLRRYGGTVFADKMSRPHGDSKNVETRYSGVAA